ncbi:MAG: CBS domain-containing protein [Chloroflexi bacterium]|nr:CBS domain-containing protein [Chloroflexota bacterium]
MDEIASADITRAQELIYELKIEQVMTKDVITCAPDLPIRDLKELLRVKRISGVPVLYEGHLVGMISIENLIQALEKGDLSSCVRDHMTTAVQTVRADDSVVSAVNLFAKFGYGRFPVMNADGDLVGLLTKGDIVRGLLRQMEVRWHAEEIQRYRASHIFQDIESDETGLILRYKVAQHDFVHGGEASSKIKRALDRLGAHPRIIRRVAVAAYEAETNLIIHSVGGELIAEVRPDRVRITAIDSGPGIPDVEAALTAGFSTAPDWIREMGFGAGIGLSNIKACSDEMKLVSEVGVGTRLEMTFNLQ